MIECRNYQLGVLKLFNEEILEKLMTKIWNWPFCCVQSTIKFQLNEAIEQLFQLLSQLLNLVYNIIREVHSPFIIQSSLYKISDSTSLLLWSWCVGFSQKESDKSQTFIFFTQELIDNHRAHQELQNSKLAYIIIPAAF